MCCKPLFIEIPETPFPYDFEFACPLLFDCFLV
uniref:Uncharacterized protein n=1 Tax=Anguilla anguilla TaxID=7936 RepID=A0A0E9Y111_ANGAN